MSTSFYGSTISSVWKAYGTYSTSETNTAVTISLVGGFRSLSWRFWISYVDCTAYIGSSSTTTEDNNVHMSSSATKNYQMVSKSKTISKTTSAQTITLKIKTYNHSGYKDGTSTASTTITIPALTSYKITYNANGGSGAPSSQTKYYGKTLTLSTTKPTRTNYTFLGWATSSSATTAKYSAGDSYTANSAATLYAVWSLDHSVPTISNISIYRCDSSGSASDTDTYIYTGFDWSIEDDYEVDSIDIKIVSSAAETSNTDSISASGSSGTVSTIYGSSFESDYDYTVTCTVTDTADSSTSISRVVGSTNYIIDFLKGGTGVAIGGAATEENLFDCKLPANFDEDITYYGTVMPIFQYGYTTITPSAANTPTSKTITFDVPYTSTPRIVVTPVTSVPGTSVTGVGVNSVGTDGFKIWLTRTNTTSTSIAWLAFGS